jgi:2-(1,2-epoxy-1,2-dihydrophenyl)acetyl-CoA isomerase
MGFQYTELVEAEPIEETVADVAEPPQEIAAETEPVILSEVVDRVGTITMNRPARRNALNGELIGALDAAVRQMADDPEVKVVILTGAAPEGGHGGFCSGGDIKGGGRGSPGSEKGVPAEALSGDLSRHDLHAAMLLHLMPKPTIAMVGGPAVGAGCSLAAACDLRFASEDSVFSASFSPNGLSGDYGGSFFWTRIAGTALARRLYLLNEKIPGPRALDLGMVHAVLPPRELRSYTYEIANQLVRTPAALLALVKNNLNDAEDEVERRRWLFAHEAENQGQSAKAMMERLAQKRQAAEESAAT